MITIENHKQINRLLNDIGAEATRALNKGLKFTVEFSDNGITKKQFNAMHVWCRQCVEYLNEKGLYMHSPVKGKMMPWNEVVFKESVYKPLLKAYTKKPSTKHQSTKDPEDIRLMLSAHMATEYDEDVQLPEWPSNRG